MRRRRPSGSRPIVRRGLGLRYDIDVEGHPADDALARAKAAGASEADLEETFELFQALDQLAFAPPDARAGIIQSERDAAERFLKRCQGEHRVIRRLAWIGIALCLWLGPRAAWADAGGAKTSPVHGADATTLYNAGTTALTHDALGPAVTFLLAAARLEPRASDIQANLNRALIEAARAAGEDVGAVHPDAGSALSLSPVESWWLAALLLAVGAVIVVLGCVSRAAAAGPMDRIRRSFSLGFALSAWLHVRAWEETAHPEAVVVVPALSVERGPEEPSRPPVLLGAGERVRLGETRGGLIEIRIGSNRIGWAVREGVWRVSDAARYTSRFEAK